MNETDIEAIEEAFFGGLEIEFWSNFSFSVFSYEALLCLCLLVGLVRLWRFLSTLLSSYFRRRLDLKKRYGGGWALVTGGSEGIG
jgi:17beta-estradiol 17-dehydrogenase / very-long-chain 3-oxoacyl-CoA reductase